MLFVKRDRIPLPPSATHALKIAREETRLFYRRVDRIQERFSFKSEPWQTTWDSLRELFSDTCAYCETPEVLVDLTVDHFRPVTEASNLDGVSDSDWYWWLAYEWSNLYPVCIECLQHKNNLFPVSGKRLPKEKKPTPQNKEDYLLIDPCVNPPTDYLRFLDSGIVEPIVPTGTSSTGTSRGATTIEVLGLNRAELVQRRKEAADRVLNRLNPFQKLVRQLDSEQLLSLARTLEQLVDEYSSFVALKRHIVARFLLSNRSLYDKLAIKQTKIISGIKDEINPYLELEKRFVRSRKSVNQQIKGVAQIIRPVSITHDNVYIKRIEIQNFRNISEFDITLKTELSNVESVLGLEAAAISLPGSAFRASWKMLLGENGAGKSSVLKAIAIALMGKQYYETNKIANRIEPPQIFNRQSTKRNGFIRITLSKGDPIEVRFTKSKLTFVSGEEASQGIFIRGYGSARLFTHPEDQEDAPNAVADEMQQVLNLFHPEKLLLHPIEWLKSNLDSLDSTALSFRDLLNLPKDLKMPLTHENDEIMLDTGNGPIPLTDQSDGYKTVLAFVLNILAGLPKSVHDKRAASGIILIDEIDSHLHPRWKMRIVRNLRLTFPKLQFIATTHEPLCLRGLGEGEIAVMKKSTERIEVEDNLPSTADLRIDQLLTSRLFGLESTIDPVIDEKFYNYYQLLSNSTEGANRLSDEERERQTNELRNQLKKYNTLGFTRRDQMVYDLIDKYLAKVDGASAFGQSVLYEETKRRVFEIWDLINVREQ